MYLYGIPEGTFPFRYFSEKKIETRKLERKSKQQISRLNDLFYHLNDTISRMFDKSLKRYKIE